MLLSTLAPLLFSALSVLALPVDKTNDMTQSQSKRISAAEYIGVADKAAVVEASAVNFEVVDSAEIIQEAHNLARRLFAAEYLDGTEGEEVVEAYPAYVDAADSAKVMGEVQDLTKRIFAAEYVG